MKPSGKTAAVLQQLDRLETVALDWLMQTEMMCVRVTFTGTSCELSPPVLGAVEMQQASCVY